MAKIYLDHNATTPVHPEVLAGMMPCFSEEFGNPSSGHSFGQRARRLLDRARSELATSLNANSDEIVFTSGGSESANLALMGFVMRHWDLTSPFHVITCKTEHNAVLKTSQGLERKGVMVSYLGVNSDGLIDLEQLEGEINESTRLVSIMLANNETGVIQPIREIADMLAGKGIVLHSDAVQGFGKIAFTVDDLGVDLLSISGHKINAPKGVGALWIRRGVKLDPIITGGSQEQRLRAGTENIPAIVGLGLAAELYRRDGDRIRGEEEQLRDRLQERLCSEIPDAVVNGAAASRTPNTLNISFPGISSEALVTRLDMRGVAVSSGAACSTGAAEPSHVVRAMSTTPELALSSIRISLGYNTTVEEIDQAVAIIVDIVNAMRA